MLYVSVSKVVHPNLDVREPLKLLLVYFNSFNLINLIPMLSL